MPADNIDLTQAASLALIQGLTEFLPISSSAHLALVPLLTSWPDQGLAFDCVVHLGTLTAVLVYFRHELARMATGFAATLSARSWRHDADGRLAWFILLATVPVGLAGLIFKDVVAQQLRSVQVIAWASIGFGLLLWLAERSGRRRRGMGDWTLITALAVGCAQALALIPGTSRSGITMTAALLLGFERKAAARFSFLLAIPVIVLAGALEIKDWLAAPQQAAGVAALLVGYTIAAISAYACIHYFLAFLERTGMTPYVLYRVALGLLLLVV